MDFPSGVILILSSYHVIVLLKNVFYLADTLVNPDGFEIYTIQNITTFNQTIDNN